MRSADEERDLVVAFLQKRAAGLKHTGTGSRHRAETVKVLSLDIAAGKHRPEYVPPRHDSCCCNWGAAVKGEYPEFGCYACPVHKAGLGEQPHELCKRHKREVQNEQSLIQ